MNRLISVTDYDGTVITYSYDGLGNVLKQTQNEKEIIYTYNAMNQMTVGEGNAYSVGDVAFMESDDAFARNISHRTDIDVNGYFVVVAHGTSKRNTD